jgi:hypothetical protein
MGEQFSSLPQACGFVRGRLTGLAGSTRYSRTELSDVVRNELREISELLHDAVKHFDEVQTKTAHSTK